MMFPPGRTGPEARLSHRTSSRSRSICFHPTPSGTARPDVDALLEMIEEQHQLSLWLSIGFHSVPRSAQYGNEDVREDYDDLGVL